jgi:hypothetical protein
MKERATLEARHGMPEYAHKVGDLLRQLHRARALCGICRRERASVYRPGAHESRMFTCPTCAGRRGSR